MKSLFFLGAFLAYAATGMESLEDVFGSVERVEEMLPPWKNIRTRSRKSTRFFDLRQPDNCVFPFEIVIIQDATSSFEDDYEQMKSEQLPEMFATIQDAHPDSKFSLITFKDKPIPPFGTVPTTENLGYSDYCQRFHVDFTEDVSKIYDHYNSETPNGGGDPAENQFGAILAATQSNRVSWNSEPDSTKLIVVVTDSPPHFENDGLDTKGMKPASGVFDDSDPDLQCVTEYYPSPAQVLASIYARGVYSAFLVYDPEDWSGLPAKSWQWFNRYIGQVDDFANLNAADSSNFWPNLLKVIQEIENLECGTVTSSTTSTTIPPTSTTILTSTTPPSTTVAGETTAVCEHECPPCVPCESEICPPCVPASDCTTAVICEEGVVIKLGYEPKVLNLEIDGRVIDV